MNPLVIGVLVLGAIAAAGYARTGMALKDLKIFPKKLSYVKQAGFWQNISSQKFKFDLTIENPNSKTVDFQKFIADVMHNNQKIAEINVEKKIPLAGKDTSVLSGIVFSVNTFALGKDIWSLIVGGEKANVSFNINGHITANGYEYPVDEDINL